MKSTSDPDSFIKYIYRTILKSFFLRPYLFFNIELLGSIFFHLKNKKNQSNMHKTALELVSIGVLPQHAGIGIGKKLLKEFEKYAKENKIRKLKLSVLNSNEDGISFYLSNQWIKKPISSTKYIFSKKKLNLINSIYNFVPYTIKCVLASVYGFYLDNIRYDSNLIKRVEKYIERESWQKSQLIDWQEEELRELFSMQRSMCHTTENIGKQKMNLLPN